MRTFDRRTFLGKAAGTAVAGAMGPALWARPAHARTLAFEPEPGAKLRVLRWSKFVQGDIDAYMANIKRFTAKTGVEVRVENEPWQDVRTKAALAVSIGAGPDIILSSGDNANLFPEKLVDVTDLCDDLGERYGGWFPAVEAYLRPDGRRWIGVPLGVSGVQMVYRESMVKAAGFDAFPKDLDGFMKLFKALKRNGVPGGLALNNCADAAWTLWLVWTFGGALVDKDHRVTINSPETIAALEYARELYAQFIPGTLSWQDPSNNKVFLDGQISVTWNAISIYYVAKHSTDPKFREIAADTNHAHCPVGPVGKPTEPGNFFNQMIMAYTKYPNAAKAFVRFMMEADQYNAWLENCGAYITHPLQAYDANPVWTADPKQAVFRDSARNMRPSGYAGRQGHAAAAAQEEYVIANMVAEVASGTKTPKEAAERAQKRAERLYGA